MKHSKNSKIIETYWNPTDNESIHGIIIDKLNNIGRYNSKLYKIQDENKIYNIWGSIQLDEIMKTTAIGDKITLTYKGKIKTSRYTMKKYKLDITDDTYDTNT